MIFNTMKKVVKLLEICFIYFIFLFPQNTFKYKLNMYVFYNEYNHMYTKKGKANTPFIPVSRLFYREGWLFHSNGTQGRFCDMKVFMKVNTPKLRGWLLVNREVSS